MAALATRHSADKHPGGYIPNKGFNDIKPYSGDRGQGLLPWLQLFRSRANLVHTPDADIARELCLKLEGQALQSCKPRAEPQKQETNSPGDTKGS